MAKYLKRASMGPYHTVSNRSLPTLHMSPGCQAPLLVLTPCISQILRVGLYTRYVHVPASHVDAASSGRQWSSKSTPWSPASAVLTVLIQYCTRTASFSHLYPSAVTPCEGTSMNIALRCALFSFTF